MPLFETSALFILLYAYQGFTGDTSYAAQFSTLLEGYAEYLVPNSLYPAKQLISVDVIRPSPNQTGLAIQSTIGLKAASFLTGNGTYSNIAADFVNAIYYGGLGLDGLSPQDSTHFTYNYGKNRSWNVLFPAYSDVLLQLNTFPQEAWDLQSDWYLEKSRELGLPFCGRFSWGLTDWNIVAASVSSTVVQQTVINTTHAFLMNGQNSIPFGTKYLVEGPRKGQWIGNKNRASVGSHFALLALKQ